MFKKKRPINQNLRKSDDNDSSSDSDSNETTVDFGAIADLKMEQNARKKVRGVISSNLQIDEKSRIDLKSNPKRSIESMIGSQFSSHIDNGLSATKHEQLMEKYVQEKLGVVHSSSTTKADKAEDSIYRIPDNLRVSEKDTTADSSDNTLLAAGAGIAEIALPISFKLANIEATESARRKLKEDHSSGSNRKAWTQSARFATPAPFSGANSTVVTATTPLVATVAIPNPTEPYVVGGNSSTGTVAGDRDKVGVRRQHDDFLASKFIKSQNNRKH